MFMFDEYFKELIQEYVNSDFRLSIIRDCTLDNENFTKINIGDMINIVSVPTENITSSIENAVMSMTHQMKNSGKGDIVEVNCITYILAEDGGIEAAIYKNPTLEAYKEMHSIDKTKIIGGITRMEFTDGLVGWAVFAPAEPRNQGKIHKRILENELGFEL